MLSRLFLIVILMALSAGCVSKISTEQENAIVKAEMYLSAFGVESDDYPNIEATIDFEKGTSLCKVSYYNPKHKPFEYKLANGEIETVLSLLEKANLDNLKKEYISNRTDQSTSTIKIYTKDSMYTIKDYGLHGDTPLPEIYDIVYKFETTIK